MQFSKTVRNSLANMLVILKDYKEMSEKTCIL